MLSYRKLAMRVLGRPLHTGGGGGGGGISSPRPASQRAAAFILTAAMLTTFTAPAFAKTWDIEKGDITVKAGEAEGPNKVKQGDSDFVKDEGDTIITGTSDKNTVTIEAENKGDKVEVTLKDVNIEATGGKAAVSVTGSGDTTIELDGDNKLKSGAGHAGLEHNKTDTSGELTIQDKDKNGSLKAAGGFQGAGIGSAGSNDAQVKITGGEITATGEDWGAGIGSGLSNTGTGGTAYVEITGGEINATGGSYGAGIGSAGSNDAQVKITGGNITATGGNWGAGIGGGYSHDSDVTISGNAKIENVTGGYCAAGIGGGTVKSNGGSGTISGGDGIRSLDHVAISGGTVKSNGGSGTNSGGYGIISNDIDLSGSLELTAKAGSPNGKALSRAGHEFDLDTIKDKLDPGAKVTTTDADGKVIQQVSIPRPVEPEKPVIPGDSSSSSGGGSADASVQESVFPGLVVTDKDGQRISYTSTQSGNTLTVCVGRFTASLRASLSTLRQLRAEGIETITFQTILCSTTLSVDELLAMGGEDTEVVLTHHIRSSTLTVNGKAV